MKSEGQILKNFKQCGHEMLPPNKSLQVAFGQPPIFAGAKAIVASNAPELRR